MQERKCSQAQEKRGRKSKDGESLSGRWTGERTLTGQVWGRWEDEDRGSQGRGQPVSERFKQKVRKKGVEKCRKAKETNVTQVLKKEGC